MLLEGYILKKWVIRAKSADFEAIAKKHNISPITARLIRNRDIISDEDIDYYLNATLDDLFDPFLLSGVDEACNIIIDAVKKNKKIRIVGDYDIDGVCATTILMRGLLSIGANVSYRLPHRIKDGYGINKRIIDEAKEDGIELIITCDNGIAAFNEIMHAKELSINVIITDHHEIPFEETDNGIKYNVPDADCVINPHLMNDTTPFKEICGAYVAYKLIIGLKKKLDKLAESDGDAQFAEYGLHKIPEEVADMLLDFAAFATVGDVMPLISENRTLVKYGLRSLKSTKNIGMSTLIDVTGVNRGRISPYHIGFVLGPCVNAVGRLYSADIALELFLTDDEEKARELANKLKEANSERRAIEEAKLNEAYDLVEKGTDGHDYNSDTVLLLYIKDCHESIAGLIAGRVKEKYNKPTICFTDGEEGIKGSGRSIEGYDIFAELSKYRDMYIKFGGHPMACGLSMDKENFEPLRELLNANSPLTEKDLVSKYYIDIDMPINYVSRELIDEIERLGPFGQGNPSPLFAQKNLRIISRKKNAKGNLLTLLVKSPMHNDKPEREIYATMFTDADEMLKKLEGRDTVTLAYVPSYNDFFSRVEIQIKDLI